MSCGPSYTGKVSTTVNYNNDDYVVFDLTDTTTTVEDVRHCIVASDIIDYPSLLLYTIKIYDEDAAKDVSITGRYLREKRPWKLGSSEQQPSIKKVKLTLVPNTEPQSSVQAVLPPYVTENNDHTTVSATYNDQEQLATKSQAIADVTLGNPETIGIPHTTVNDYHNCSPSLTPTELDNYFQNVPVSNIDMLSLFASIDLTQLKFFVDLRDNQRLVYPYEPPTMIQAKKDKKYASKHPFLQIPETYANLIFAGGFVDLVTAVVVEVVGDSQSHFCLAPYRGFWSPNKDTETSEVTSLSNPSIWQITKEQLETKQIHEEQVFVVEVKLSLMHAVHKSNDHRHLPLVRFDENFVLSAAQPAPSHINYEPGLPETNEYVQETFAKDEFQLMCLLSDHTNGNQLNWKSCCLSKKFTIKSRYHTKKQRQQMDAQQ